MKTIHAVYENWFFWPTEAVELPEGSKVRILPEPARTAEDDAHLERVCAILSRSYDTGDPKAAERHNKHQA